MDGQEQNGQAQIRQTILHLRNSLDAYLERGNVADVELIRATIAGLECHLKILDEWKREKQRTQERNT